jgi:hypothetical protein
LSVVDPVIAIAPSQPRQPQAQPQPQPRQPQAQPQPQPRQPQPQQVVPIVPPPVASDPGELWYMNFGTMQLRYNKDNTLLGDVNDLISKKQSGFNIKLENKTDIRIKYFGKFAANELALTFRNSRTTVAGNSVAYGDWCGAKENVEFLEGCSFAGRDWNVRIVGIYDCKLELKRKNNLVWGQMCDDSKLMRIVVGDFAVVKTADRQTVFANLLDYNKDKIGTLQIQIDRYDSSQFVGRINFEGERGIRKFCGWRIGFSIPSECQ